MKLNKIYSDLKEIYNGENTKNILYVEFEHKNEINELIHLFKRGVWSVMPIAFDSDNILAIRLTPSSNLLKESPVVSFDEVYKECFIYAPDIKSIIAFGALNAMRNPAAIERRKNSLDETIEKSMQFFRYLENGDLSFLKQFLFSDTNQNRFENASSHKDDFYKEFWDHYYNTIEQKKAFELFEKLKDDSTYLPDYDATDYGIWNNYVRNVLADRAYSKIKVDDKDKWKHYWHCVQLPHGFDCDDNSFNKYRISLGHSSSLLNYLSATFVSNSKDQIFPEEVQKHPIFEATRAIRTDKSYAGKSHLEAAQLLESKYDDPIAAWNSLISSSYWAGRLDRLDIVEQSWNAAIALSEKHGWLEINEVLKDQLAFYNHYKDDMQ